MLGDAGVWCDDVAKEAAVTLASSFQLMDVLRVGAGGKAGGRVKPRLKGSDGRRLARASAIWTPGDSARQAHTTRVPPIITTTRGFLSARGTAASLVPTIFM